MSTSAEYIEYICEQIEGTGEIRSRKMFGEYMVYVNDKPVLLVCDDRVFIKMLPEVEGLMIDVEKGYPYQGAKEHYILDIDDRELSIKVIGILEEITPIPKPRKKKK